MPIVWLESLGDLQRDRDSGTFVLVQINTVQQRAHTHPTQPRPSPTAQQTVFTSAGSSSSTNLRQANPFNKKNLITNCKCHRICPFFLIMETRENVQADLN